jgi:hypothetical protein
MWIQILLFLLAGLMANASSTGRLGLVVRFVTIFLCIVGVVTIWALERYWS